MQKTFKRTISILLSILMIVSVFVAVPITASAATTVDLSTLSGNYEAQDGDVLTGELKGDYQITIADGATVTLKDATITCLSASTTYDGIALLGDATILLEGENTVKGGYKYNAGIFVPEEKTLTIDGTGSLNVSSGGSASAIGAKRSGSVTGIPGGNIVINGGTINANGGNGGAGIGGCTVTNCGTITINGGNVTAVGNDSAPGIGSGNRASYCAGITITGGTVTATGNGTAAGIGCGIRGSCGNITIADTVTKVTATKGNDAPNSIGLVSANFTCGTITIGGEVTGNIAESPYVYSAPAPTYTVTWKNGDTVLETDTDVAEGTTPTYDGATPTKTSDTYYDYTFSGWFDGSNTYAADALPAVSGDVTYTAQFTSEARTFMVFVKKLTGGTINVYDVSGETTVAQLKDILASQTGAPASAQQLIFAGKTLDDAKTLAEYNIQKESTIHLVIRGYTVTWKNWNGDVLETDTGVAKDSTPTYDGATPYKADGANCIYTFSGWTPEVTAVTGDATYTATFTESEKPETIKDCTNKYGNFRLYSNVPIVSFSNVNDLLTGAIIPITYGDSNTMIPVQDAKGYSYKFYDQTGTEIPAQIANSSSAPGSNYEFSDDVTVYTNVINFTRPAGCTAIYIVATEPAPAPTPAKLILHVGENGKVVMDNGTFGNATDASNIVDIAMPIDVADDSKIFIVDGHTANLVEGGSINIATGGEVSFYPSADNTGEITAVADEGYICTGWYDGDELYTIMDTIDYQKISEDITLTAKFAPTYTVTWKNWNGDVLKTKTVVSGATPIYDDQDPVQPDDELYKYTFTGWAPDVTAVTGDAEYTAQFDREDRGAIIDGKYYVDGVLKKSLGLIYLDGEYYYVMVTGEIYKNNSLSLAESKANGYIPQGRYYFDNEGKMSFKNGIVAGYYYVNDELQKGAGLVKIGNDFYFVKQNGAVYKDASLYVAEAKTNGLMPAGKYFFDENGKMEVKNGVYGGFYYENNQIVKGKGIVEFENNLYFVKQNGAVYTTHHLMVPEAKTNGLIAPGLYDFEDDGRLIR